MLDARCEIEKISPLLNEAFQYEEEFSLLKEKVTKLELEIAEQKDAEKREEIKHAA